MSIADESNIYNFQLTYIIQENTPLKMLYNVLYTAVFRLVRKKIVNVKLR